MGNFFVLECKLGYTFQNQALLKQSMTHRSRSAVNNERLEFLGDSVLGYVVAEGLYQKFPNVSEGDLTRMRSKLVRAETLSKIALDISLQDFILLGESELKNGGIFKDSILADALEALIAGVCLDGGIQAVIVVIETLFQDLFETITPENLKDNKTRLQEFLQKTEREPPKYEMIHQIGVEHRPEFYVKCYIADIDQVFAANGRNKKIAEQKAAAIALEFFKNTSSISIDS